MLRDDTPDVGESALHGLGDEGAAAELERHLVGAARDFDGPIVVGEPLGERDDGVPWHDEFLAGDAISVAMGLLAGNPAPVGRGAAWSITNRIPFDALSCWAIAQRTSAMSSFMVFCAMSSFGVQDGVGARAGSAGSRDVSGSMGSGAGTTRASAAPHSGQNRAMSGIAVRHVGQSIGVLRSGCGRLQAVI
jgi:hypothetical protein